MGSGTFNGKCKDGILSGGFGEGGDVLESVPKGTGCKIGSKILPANFMHG